MKHILLVDDHRTFLAGSAIILEKHGFRVTTASSGAEALERMEQSDFDLFVFDLKLPRMNGFELTEATLQRRPEATIVILTGEDISEHYDRLIDMGVTGIMEKSLGELELIYCLRLALQQLTVLPLHLAKRLRTKENLPYAPNADSGGSINRMLTDKEVAVLKLIAQGHKNKDIADRLFMSQRNVEYLISHLFEKLGVSSRQQAVMKGIELKWLNVDA
ncbi:response regulator transcription factor [Paenibacillus allorhizosphaerae]|uniref:Transcriptional regulatory protein ComA n=1 Tax=Paenibacillus allorhizosphaerae TaxID=2849866 RepID=A0ABM8V9Z0_9BACL|nr:response regulator transcription factor [Paenibacillus allorhizosphaerae]CAG7614876.1 Transcriptional regulatory protein ComA [Paenibacillus allorhizosphaerae]